MIESLNNDKIKYLKKLKLKKYINEENKFLVEGFHLVEEALKKNIVSELILLKDTKINFNGEKTFVTMQVMKELSFLETVTPVIAVCRKFESSEILGNKIVLLDGIQDPGNVGTIIRNCVAFNVDTIIFSKDSVSLYNEKVIRGSQGMIFNVNIITGDLTDFINILKQKEIKIYGTALEYSKELDSIEKQDSYAIVFGNEGSGVKKEILDICDENIKIEISNKCESLNVGVASGIILYHMR